MRAICSKRVVINYGFIGTSLPPLQGAANCSPSETPRNARRTGNFKYYREFSNLTFVGTPLVNGDCRAHDQCAVSVLRRYFVLSKATCQLAVLLLAATVSLVFAPAASANSVPLTNNNLGISGSLGTVTWVQSGADVKVTFSMTPGYALVTNGGDIGFSTAGGLVLTGSSLSNFSINGLSASLKPNGTIGSFTFDFLYKTSVSGGQQFPTSLTLTISNAQVTQITGFGVHFGVLDGRGCSRTGFATTGSSSVVPEPGTISLLGTGLLGLAGVVRRRLGC